MNVSQTPVWLALGALLGVAYSLGAGKYSSAMTHPHLYVRGAMLWLSCVAWLAAAAALAYVSFKLQQQDDGLDGTERVFAVLVPAVVRADLIVDWAKRVMWAVFLMPTWTQGCVALRRITRRAAEMEVVLATDLEVMEMADVHDGDFAQDLVAAEESVWAEGAESLVQVNEMLEHFRRLARMSLYAIAGLIGAVPGAVIWISYGTYKGYDAWRNQLRRLAVVYWLSVLFAPIGAIVVLFVSVILLVGIVSLSVAGSLIQFSVYWSTRVVYTLVRAALAEAWAEFPFLMRRDGLPPLISRLLPPNAGAAMSLVGNRSHMHHPGHAIATRTLALDHTGPEPRADRDDAGDANLMNAAAPLPHFNSRGSEDHSSEGSVGVTVAPRPMRAHVHSSPTPTTQCGTPCDVECGGKSIQHLTEGGISSRDPEDDGHHPSVLYNGRSVARHPAEAGAAIARAGGLLPTELEFALASWDGVTVRHGERFPDFLGAFPSPDKPNKHTTHDRLQPVADDDSSTVDRSSTGRRRRRRKRSGSGSSAPVLGSHDVILMERLGMDDIVDTPRKRRLSNYYSLAMLMQMQVASGGNAWQIRRSYLRAPQVADINLFTAEILSYNSVVAVEAAEAVSELSGRLRATARYRVVPSTGRNIPTDQWLRAVLLALLMDPEARPAWVRELSLPGSMPKPIKPEPKEEDVDNETQLEKMTSEVTDPNTSLRRAWSSPLTSVESQ